MNKSESVVVCLWLRFELHTAVICLSYWDVTAFSQISVRNMTGARKPTIILNLPEKTPKNRAFHFLYIAFLGSAIFESIDFPFYLFQKYLLLQYSQYK